MTTLTRDQRLRDERVGAASAPCGATARGLHRARRRGAARRRGRGSGGRRARPSCSRCRSAGRTPSMRALSRRSGMPVAGARLAVDIRTSVAVAMRVHVAFTPAEAAAAPVGIVVDVLRATSTIAQALAAGLPPRALLRGDRRGAARCAATEGPATLARRAGTSSTIDGFDFGTSPREFLEPRGRDADPHDDERHAAARRRGRARASASSSAPC